MTVVYPRSARLLPAHRTFRLPCFHIYFVRLFANCLYVSHLLPIIRYTGASRIHTFQYFTEISTFMHLIDMPYGNIELDEFG